ncbi:MAG: menaquinone biosynthetic enzyme MqnA/MqnD family protein [Polyangiaceae bacterium]
MTSSEPTRLRVAAVGYLNARPLYEPLCSEAAAARVILECAAPSVVARRVAEGDADIALMPIAAAAALGDLRMVRGCAIGARGVVRSVVIAADQPIERLEELAVDLSSRTSVVLARLLLRARHGREPRLIGCSPAEAIASIGGRRGALVIGDPALEIEGRHRHVLDLGAAWLEHTRLPFVFAAWCGNKGALTAEGERMLQDAKDAGLVQRDVIAGIYAAQSGLPVESLRAYLRDAIRYDLGDDERRGLERFYADAARERLLPEARVRFFDEDRAAPPRPVALDTVLARAAEGERLSAAEGERLS